MSVELCTLVWQHLLPVNVLEASGGKLHALCFASDASARINQREAHVMLFLSENEFCSR